MKPYTLHHGDCIEVMRGMADNSVDAIVTDPPYELGFMGKAWDASGIANNVAMWKEALRVLKPGGHLLAFSGARTSHRMVCAIEDAGFEIRDSIHWIYGSGFPKSQNVSKAIDKQADAAREVISEGKAVKRMIPGADQDATGSWIKDNGREYVPTVTQAATPEAAQWEGWGTALKPAHEPICMARKPLIGTVVANVLAHGTGAINIDACRVPTDENLNGGAYAESGGRAVSGSLSNSGMNVAGKTVGTEFAQPTGRWPANIIHDGSDEVLDAFPDAPGQMADASTSDTPRNGQNTYGALRKGRGDEPSANSENAGAVGFKMKPGARRGDAGSAARFFYCAKASRTDRNEGIGSSSTPAVETNATMRDCETTDWSTRNGNHHPTVKPTDLMAYLCRLVTPPGGVILDPFMGSGSTGKACMREGFQFIGIDMTAEYVAIAEARIKHEQSLPKQEVLFV